MDLLKLLKELYPDHAHDIYHQTLDLIDQEKTCTNYPWLSEKDVMLITYGDSMISDDEKPLKTLHRFLDIYLKDVMTDVHLLPMFPYSSDDGFSVIDYMKINPDLGTWDDIKSLGSNYHLMFDGVINHISKESDWFKGYLNNEKKYRDFFIPCDPDIDYAAVTRPRALPLYYAYQAKDKQVYLWATFSEDQVDLNYKNPEVLLSILKILIYYAKHGARFIRLDAIGFLWKEIGTACIHLPNTHKLIQIMRYVIDQTVPGTLLISETNVPHKENISYFGNDDNEASLVYQFPLPPLVLHTFITQNSHRLSIWVKSLDETPLHPKNTYFNFLASHDGIGVRPVEDLLDKEEKLRMLNHVIEAGGQISFKSNSDGTESPYEMNISYVDAITYGTADHLKVQQFISSQAILVFLKGVPGIYIHSLLGTKNDIEGLTKSGIKRRINRKKLHMAHITNTLNHHESFEAKILNAYNRLLKIRQSDPSFSPDAEQEVIFDDKRLLIIKRKNKRLLYSLVVIINTSHDVVKTIHPYHATDFLNDLPELGSVNMNPFEYKILKVIE